MDMDSLVMTERVARLRDKMLSEQRFASVEQAKLITVPIGKRRGNRASSAAPTRWFRPWKRLVSAWSRRS